MARTGGRPFLCLEEISVEGEALSIGPEDFQAGTSGIPPREILAHFAAGRGVNRLWLTHAASNGFPVVVLLTPDGFLNVGGAQPPRQLGAASRFGFIGEPFGEEDFRQHLDRLSIEEVDDDTLRLTLDVHSEVGEGALEVVVHWQETQEVPRVEVRLATSSRLDRRLGFAGLNFLRGPTLFGLKSEAGSPEGGIEAFHDGRSLFVAEPSGAFRYVPLTPPVMPGVVEREEVSTGVAMGTRLIVDQPQGVERYFSRTPGVPYEERADLTLTLLEATRGPVDVRRAQIAVDLADVNPEANETANLFFVAPQEFGTVEEFTLRLEVAAEDFEAMLALRPAGVVYVSTAAWPEGSLEFLPLDDAGFPAGAPQRLTDGVTTDPRRPSASEDGRFVIFDADLTPTRTGNRIYLLDRMRGTVRRISVDPFGGSNDDSASLSPDGTRVALITNRRGQDNLAIHEVATGLRQGFGSAFTRAQETDWSPTRNEIAIIHSLRLQLFDVETETVTDLADVDRSLLFPPAGLEFSPDGERIAYADDAGVWVIARTGGTPLLVAEEGRHPTWLDAGHLILEREALGERDLFRLTLGTRDLLRLTPADGIDAFEPAFVPAHLSDCGSTALCLGGGRFQLRAQWATSAGETGVGHPVPLTDDTGYFWFFQPSNIEAVVKILDACAPFGHYWFFAGGLTNVEVTLELLDTFTGVGQSYTNLQGTAFAPIQDTAALGTCP